MRLLNSKPAGRSSLTLNCILTGIFLIISAVSCTTVKEVPVAQESEPLPGGGTAWTAEVDRTRKSLVLPPEDIPCFTQFLLGIAENEFRKELLPARVLTWSGDLSVASGALELYIEEGAADLLSPRLIYLLRMQVSFHAGCPFAIDVNSWQYKEHSITRDEIKTMQNIADPDGPDRIDQINSFSEREKAALKYAAALTRTPVQFDGKLLEDLRALFSREEIVAIAALSAKVNYWARFIEAMRIKPAGYTDDPILDLERFNSFEEPAEIP